MACSALITQAGASSKSAKGWRSRVYRNFVKSVCNNSYSFLGKLLELELKQCIRERRGKSMLNRKRQQKNLQTAETHRLNMQKNLQRRLESARASGNEALIQQLQAEANYIGLN